MGKKFNHLHVPDHWEQYWSRYPQGYTILEALINWVSQVDKMVDNVNDWNDYLDEFVEKFDEKLQDTVRYIIQELLDSGELVHIINQVLLDTHIYTYNTMGDMVNDTGLIEGDRVQTLGYYFAGDGGGSQYVIEETGVKDYGNPTLSNGRHARLIHGGKVKANQYGAGEEIPNNEIYINQALQNVNHVELLDHVYPVTDTVIISSYQSLIGSPNTREQGDATIIEYNGVEDSHKTTILVGRNEVDGEPVNDGSNIRIENLYIDCNNLCGFGVYGTYLTNQTYIHNIVVRNSLEYNFYFSRSWYATFRRLTSLSCRNNGLSFAMPLEYFNGTAVNWTTHAPIEMNNTTIAEIQSQRAGTYFADDNPDTWNIANHSKKGNGILIGVGNALTVDGFTSEKSGGVNLYVYHRAQPVKKIRGGYLEHANQGSGLSSTERCSIIYESGLPTGSSIVFEDIFINYNNGGGIYITGSLAPKRVRFKNVHQPRFLRPYNLEGITTSQELSYYVVKENVYSGAGTYNSDPALNNFDLYIKTNSRYSINSEDPERDGNVREFNYQGTTKLIYARNIAQDDGTFLQPYGSLGVQHDDGTKTPLNFPSGFADEWVLLGTANSSGVGLTKLGGSGDTTRLYEIKVFSAIPTYY